MKIKEGFVLREAAGSFVVMDRGGELAFNGMMTVNESGALIWRAVEEGADEDSIARKITEVYETDLETALRDVRNFIAKLNEAGILEQTH